MIIDLRTYKCLPGRMAAQLELYGKYGYPIQQRYIGDPLCYLVAESGGLNTMVHAWVYESAADREAKRARMGQDPEWKLYLAENVKAAEASVKDLATFKAAVGKMGKQDCGGCHELYRLKKS